MDLYPSDVWVQDATLDYHSRGVRFGPSSDLFICDGNHIFKYTEAGITEIYAGSEPPPGKEGYDVRREGKFSFDNYAYGMCWTPNGDMYVVESTSNLITRIRDTEVSIYAGSTASGLIDGPLAQARFSIPCDIVYAQDRLIVCDGRNIVLRSIDMENGIVSTIKTINSPSSDPGPFKFPFGLSLSPSKTHLYVADLDCSKIFELDLDTLELGVYCDAPSPRSVACLPSGEILANSYSDGIMLCKRGSKKYHLLDGPLLFANHYDLCVDHSTGRMVVSGSKVRVFSNVFEPHIDWKPSTLDYVRLRTDTDHFVPDLKFTDVQGDAHPYHSYILNLLFLLEDIAPSTSASSSSKLNWVETKSAQLLQIKANFPSLSLEILFDALYGSVQKLSELEGDEFVNRTLEIATALVDLGFDAYFLYKLLESKAKRLSIEKICTYIALIWNQHNRPTAAHIYARALNRFPSDQWLLEESFGKNSPNLHAAIEMYTERSWCLLKPLKADCEGLPLQDAMWKAALGLKFVEGKFSSVVPNSQFVFEVIHNATEGYVLVERWPLYLHWPWLRFLIDAGLTEAKTGIATLPSDFPVPLLLYIIGYFYTLCDSKQASLLLSHFFDYVPRSPTLPQSLQVAIEFCLSRGGEFGLVDLERRATEEARTAVELLHSNFARNALNHHPYSRYDRFQLLGTPEDIATALKDSIAEFQANAGDTGAHKLSDELLALLLSQPPPEKAQRSKPKEPKKKSRPSKKI